MRKLIIWFSTIQIGIRILDGINMLRGFFIFLVFVCKPSILDKVEKKFPRMGVIRRVVSNACCWGKCVPHKNLQRKSTFYSSQKTVTTPLPKTTNSKFRFDVRYISVKFLRRNISYYKEFQYDKLNLQMLSFLMAETNVPMW